MKIKCTCDKTLKLHHEALDSEGCIMVVEPHNCESVDENNTWVKRASNELEVLRGICLGKSSPKVGEWNYPEILERVVKLLEELCGEKSEYAKAKEEECDYDDPDCFAMDGCCRTHQLPLSEKGKKRLKRLRE